MSKTLTIIGRLKAKAGKENELRATLIKLVPLSRSETGCINYDLHESLEESGLFLLYENWVDRAALDRHFSFSYSQEFAAKSSDLLAEPLRMLTLREISSAV
jgi:quinol monooxygenase YgiN